ncbi:TadE/TadG family type IV pilus assembly protein [Methylobacterium oxalidis]|uniref:TadE/TadG family type IV pilus assembly protein n=1 Tax=Methylobacterium oxalidis TaxID=944322 RepID=UPI00331611F1
MRGRLRPLAREARAVVRRSRLARDCRGATAVEFALVAVPFLSLLCVIVEAGFVFLSQQTLDIAVDRASRLLRTGEFQQSADGTEPTGRLRRLMCGNRFVFFRCDDVRLDVTRAGRFSASQVPPAFDSTRKDFVVSFGTRFDCPEGNDVVAVRAAVPVLRPFSFLTIDGQAMSGGRQLLTSTSIFRTEPYQPRSCS